MTTSTMLTLAFSPGSCSKDLFSPFFSNSTVSGSKANVGSVSETRHIGISRTSSVDRTALGAFSTLGTAYIPFVTLGTLCHRLFVIAVLWGYQQTASPPLQ